MDPLGSDDRLEYAIRHPKVFSADAREGRSRRIVTIILFLIGAAFVSAYGVWFANMREAAAESAGKATQSRSRLYVPAVAATVHLATIRDDAFPPARISDDVPNRIYKCVGKSGATAFQQSPCAAGLKTEKVIGYVWKPEPLRAQSLPSAPTATPSSQYGSSVRYATEVPRNTECRAAEIWADDRRRELGIRATFADLRMLQDYVYERCK
jgi:hypothetical protein